MSRLGDIIELPDENPDKFLGMPEGLKGYWWETEKQICVPLVISKNEGNGTFTKWLDLLETKGKTIFFPSIVSKRLEGILRRRGYIDAFVMDKELGFVDGLAKDVAKA
mgnify:CR=1 FL=1